MTAAHDQEARARALATRLVRGPNVGADDGDTYIPRTPTIDELTDHLLSFAAEREAIVREEAAKFLDQQGAAIRELMKDGDMTDARVAAEMAAESWAAAIRGNAGERP